jgi:putative tryptophan/tyrosine transport system substrate-binding protein
MRRREFIAGLGSAVAWPVVARAQQARMPVIGYLYPMSREARPEFLGAFHRGLGKTGFIERRNVSIEYRWGDGNYDLLPSLLADLIRRQVDVIAAPAVRVGLLKAVAPTIPTVFASGVDPVEAGVAASLNRPGGNFTGAWALSAEVMAKRVQLLHELVPAAATFGFLVNQAYPNLAEIETREARRSGRLYWHL